MEIKTIVPDEVDTLDQSIYIARHIRNAIQVLRPLVYRVYTEKLWEGRFSSFAEYVESPNGLNRSQGYASKLRQVEEFRLTSGLSEEEIFGLDHESLYLSIKAGGTPEEIVRNARTLNRQQLRAERSDKEDHEHEWVEACSVCWIRKP